MPDSLQPILIVYFILDRTLLIQPAVSFEDLAPYQTLIQHWLLSSDGLEVQLKAVSNMKFKAITRDRIDTAMLRFLAEQSEGLLVDLISLAMTLHLSNLTHAYTS